MSLLIFSSLIISSELLFSNKWHGYFEEADKAIISGEYTEAVSKYLKGINYADRRNIVKVWDDLGFAYFQLGRYSKAKSYLKISISTFPENFNSRLYLAACYFSNNETALALDELNKIDKNIYFNDRWIYEINNIKLLNEYGDEIPRDSLERIRKEKGIYLARKKTDADNRVSAVFYIDAFNEINEGVFYFLQGCVFSKLGDYTKAEIKLKKAIQAGYDERDVKIQLQDLYLRYNKTEKEQKMAAEIEKPTIQSREIHFKIQHRLADHNNSLLWYQMREFLKTLETGQIEAAAKKLEDGLLINEKSFPINHNLALLYFDEYQLDNSKLDKLEKAEIFCARTIWYKDYQTVNKDDIIGCYDLMGNIYFAQKVYDKALKEYKKILEIDEYNPYAFFNLGSTYYVLKDWQNAEHYWKRAIESEQKKAKKKERKKPLIEEDLEHFVTVQKKSIYFLSHQALGKLYFEQDSFEKAIIEFNRAAELEPNKPEPYFYLGKIYRKKKKIKKAVSYLEKYLYLGGKREEEVRELLENLKKIIS